MCERKDRVDGVNDIVHALVGIEANRRWLCLFEQRNQHSLGILVAPRSKG
jgi:hypothetical protein